MTKQDMVSVAMRQMAVDHACEPADLLKESNTVVRYRQMPGRRLFSTEDYFFMMATFGHGAVVSVNDAIRPWCEDYFKKHRGIDCFEYPNLREIDEALRPYGHKLHVNAEGYLTYPGFPRKIKHLDMDLRWYEKDEIPGLYEDKRFNNAILYDANSLRPDMIAIAAYDHGKIVGMAGCSKDCESLWQIGIDVIPEYRQNGIATTLVSLLTDEIIKRGKIPYYGTWCSNIASRTIAQNCGYFPAWVETYSIIL